MGIDTAWPCNFAGAVFGLLIYKPPLFAPIFAVLLLSGSWAMAIAMLVSAGLEVASTALWVGLEGIADYVNLVLSLPSMASMMAARPDQMHSLRAFWSLVFGESAATAILYGISAIMAMAGAAHVWRRAADPSLRMAALLLATVLAAPHLYVYDLVLLAPVWMWLAEWYLSQPLPKSVGRTLYIGYLAAFAGYLATLLPLQLTVVCFVYLLGSLWWWTTTAAGLEEIRPAEHRGERSYHLQHPAVIPALISAGHNQKCGRLQVLAALPAFLIALYPLSWC
jgi:hypothetical protein